MDLNKLKPWKWGSKTPPAGPIEGKVVINPFDQISGSFGWDTVFGSPTVYNSCAKGLFGMTPVELELAFSKHPTVRACTSILADTAVQPRLEVGRFQGGDWAALPGHESLDLLAAPSPSQSQGRFIRDIVSRWALTGFGFTIIIRNNAGRPMELNAVPTSWVTVQKDGNGHITGYKISGNNEPFPVEDVFAFKDFDPSSIEGSVSKLESAAAAFKLDLERYIYENDMITNLDFPGVIIRKNTRWTDDQKEEAMKRFEQKYSRGGGRGKPFFAEGNGGIEAFNPLEKLDFPGLEEMAETAICSAFGVPPIVAHTRAGLNKSTYANYETAEKAFMKVTMVSVWELLADALTFGLLRRSGEMNMQFRFRFDELPEFQEDAGLKVSRATRAFNGGIAKRNESRVMAGLEKDPGQDLYKDEITSAAFGAAAGVIPSEGA